MKFKKYIKSLPLAINNGLHCINVRDFSSTLLLYNEIVPENFNLDSLFTNRKKNKNINLDPNWVTGFVDAEGSFIVLILKDKNYKTGWTVKTRFSISLPDNDLAILELIKTYLGNVGNISKGGKDSVQYVVASLNDLTNVVLPHFTKYPLITQKAADFILFKRVIESMKNKEHLTKEGLEKIVLIKGSLNLGHTAELKEAFPNINLEKRPDINNMTIKSPQWLAGFISGKGSFMIQIKKSASSKIGFVVLLEFQLAQHNRDINLMKSFINYLDCGIIYEQNQIVIFKVSKFSDINNKIIPFFIKYPIVGVKYNDFLDFCKVKELMNNKEHLTLDGLNKIREIKSGITNKGKVDNIEKNSELNLTHKNLGLTVTVNNIQKRCFHSKIRAINRIGPHNEEVISIIIGSLLGDSSANARTIEGTRICYRQSDKHSDYLFWLYDFFYTRGYCSNLKPRKYTRKLKDMEYYGYEFNTFTFRSFNWIHKLFYKKGTKYINPQLEQYLTPLALAIWIQDDGCWASSGVRIATNCFELEEVKLLTNMLTKLYNLNCTIQNIEGRYSIYITKESIPKLRDILLPYILPSMKYKLGLKNEQV